MTIRVFYTGRDFFGGILWDQEAAQEAASAAEARRIVTKCLAACGVIGRGGCNAFRLELRDGLLLVVDYAGPGAYRLTRAQRGSVDAGTLYGSRELKKVLSGYIDKELREVS